MGLVPINSWRSAALRSFAGPRPPWPPARVRSKTIWARISPPVRELISRPRAATSVRVSPSPTHFWNAFERRSAPTCQERQCENEL